jgi:hypothetical protein
MLVLVSGESDEARTDALFLPPKQRSWYHSAIPEKGAPRSWRLKLFCKISVHLEQKSITGSPFPCCRDETNSSQLWRRQAQLHQSFLRLGACWLLPCLWSSTLHVRNTCHRWYDLKLPWCRNSSTLFCPTMVVT